MKKIVVTLFCLIAVPFVVFSQAPQAINYQAIVRDSIGSPVINQNISMRLSILQDNVNGTIVYSETHTDSTNIQGLINLKIGAGTVETGDFSIIDWGSHSYYIKTEADPSGGTNYLLMGITQFLSVPYALYSEQTGDTSMWRKNQDAVYYDQGQVGIGTSEPDSSAIMEISSTSQGYLPPRMTTNERDDIENPAEGLLIYNLDCHCMNFWDGVKWVSYGADPNLDFECGGRLVDSRDGKTYNTVQIGDQCWMAENLNMGTKINGTVDQTDNDVLEKYCYDDIPANCSNYGGFYQWDEMMQYDTNRYNTGICPEGWRLPTAAEWDTLVSYLGGESVAGDALKQNGTSGFEALLAGKRLADGSFISMNTTGSFWTSSQINSLSSNYRYLNDGDAGFYENDTLKTLGLAVRCLKGLPNRVDTGVIVIDTLVYELISDSTELAQGIYRYNILQRDQQDTIVNNNIIVGHTDGGYLRKVTDTSYIGNQMVLETIQATMEDVWVTAEFSAEADIMVDSTIRGGNWSYSRINYLAKGVSLIMTRDGFRYDFENVIIYQDGTATLSIPSGHVELDPNFKFDFKFKKRRVKRLGFYTDNAKFETSIDLELSITNNYQSTYEKKLASASHFFGFLVGFVPVWIEIKTELMAYDTLNIDAQVTATTGYTNTNYIDVGLIYENSSWRKIWDFDKTETVHPLVITGQVNLGQRFSIVPEISIRVYSVAGPYFNTELYEKFNANLAIPSFNWDMQLGIGLNANIGASIEIFGSTLAQYNKQLFGFEKTLWNVPDQLIYVSGNNQTGNTNEQLSDPIKVQVIDNLGNGWPLIPVHYDITSGGGSVSENVATDTSGISQTNWTLGPSTGQNTLNAAVVKANGQHVTGSPVGYTATATGGGGGTGQPCPGIPTVYYEGQTYNTVLIGAQCWLKENLNVGTMIPGSQNMANNETIEKYCYNNDPSNCTTYGGLYQWNEMMQYVTTQGAQGICPPDWHIPTDGEWCSVTQFIDPTVNCGVNGLSGTDVGTKMKSTTGWNSGGNGTNSSGFTALPSGNRNHNGNFYSLGNAFTARTSSLNGIYAWVRELHYQHNGISRSFFWKIEGYSVRCLKD